MPDREFEKLEQALVQAGKAVSYPATPALAMRVRSELERVPARQNARLSRSALIGIAALVLALGLLLAFPETRDALAQFLGLRTIRILPVTPTPTLTVPATASAGVVVTPLSSPTAAATASPTRTGEKVRCCETTLADAQTRAKFKILLPTRESPSQVYLQELPNFGDAQQVVLVFGDPNAPRYTLYEATGFLYAKMVSGGTLIEETQVKGQRALWLSGAPHALVYLDASGRPQLDTERVVDVNTLAWEIGNLTYRLETKLAREAASAFAASLQ